MELKEFYKMQEELDNYIAKTKNLENIDKRQLISNVILALQVEIAELANELRVFKYWSNKKDYSREKALEEYVDILHFFLSLGNRLGFTPEEIEQAYIAKNRENFNRQNNGY